MGEPTNSYRLLVWTFKHTERKVEDNIKNSKQESVYVSAPLSSYTWGAEIKFGAFLILVLNDSKKVKVPPLQATKALGVGRGIALPFLRPRHWRWGWGVSSTPRPLYPRERPGTHSTGGWVGTRAGPDGCGNLAPHRDSIPGSSSP